MVKVRIEYDGNVEEIERDAVIAFFPDEESTHMVFAGKTSIERAVGALSVGIPNFLKLELGSPEEYVRAIICVREILDKKIKEELKASVVDALVKASKL